MKKSSGPFIAPSKCVFNFDPHPWFLAWGLVISHHQTRYDPPLPYFSTLYGPALSGQSGWFNFVCQIDFTWFG